MLVPPKDDVPQWLAAKIAGRHRRFNQIDWRTFAENVLARYGYHEVCIHKNISVIAPSCHEVLITNTKNSSVLAKATQ